MRKEALFNGLVVVDYSYSEQGINKCITVTNRDDNVQANKHLVNS